MALRRTPESIRNYMLSLWEGYRPKPKPRQGPTLWQDGNTKHNFPLWGQRKDTSNLTADKLYSKQPTYSNAQGGAKWSPGDQKKAEEWARNAQKLRSDEGR